MIYTTEVLVEGNMQRLKKNQYSGSSISIRCQVENKMSLFKLDIIFYAWLLLRKKIVVVVLTKNEAVCLKIKP